jgi:ribonucleotide reductase alpha subunit
MWGVTPSNRYDWSALKEKIKTHGLRNSLLVAPMPTASTAQILGNNECFEPFTSNIYSRRTNAGDYTMINKYLLKDLIDLDIWSDDLKNNIILNKGSIQHLHNIPQVLRDKYKIVWEIPMRHMIDMAADRGAYICQSQSLNLWLEDPNYKTLTSMHFYSWSKGLKTGIYYLRRKAKHQAQQFTIEPETTSENTSDTTPSINILLENMEENVCEMCSG